MTDMVKAKLNGQFEIIIPKHRADRPEWYTEKGWEKPRLDHMSKAIGKGDVVYYVGAEEGEMPALCQMWGAEVVMFEPNPKVWSNIKAIWDANGLDKPLNFIEGFASNKDQVPAGYELTPWERLGEREVIGNHGFKELNLEGDNYPQVKIDTVALKTPPPTVITMDVEGSEFEVLKGAEQTLKEHLPLIYLSLHPEFLFRDYSVYSYELRQWIMGLGYEEKLLDYQHEVHLFYKPTAKGKASE